MAEMKIYLSNSLNERFRRIAMRVYGYGRGSLSKAAEEAFMKWCSEHEPSAISDKAAGHLGAADSPHPKGAESHINPDERQAVDQSASGTGRDPPPTPIGAGS